MSLLHTPYCLKSIIWRLDPGTGMLAPSLRLISYAVVPTESLPSSSMAYGKATYSTDQECMAGGTTLTMSRAIVLDREANPITYAGIGGSKDSMTYLNIPVSSIHKALMASRL